MILHQAWALRLKDRIHHNYTHGHDHGSGNGNYSNDKNRAKVPEPCRRWNRGRCKYGATCKYEHRCSYCFKFGHGASVCRKVSADRERNHGNGNKAPAGNDYVKREPNYNQNKMTETPAEKK